MDFLPFIIIIVIVEILVVFALNPYLEKRRTHAIEALAANWGFEFVGTANDLIESSLWDFQLFRKGRSRQARNLIQGSQSRARIAIFDYRYVTGNGKNKRMHRQTVVLVTSDRLSLPEFRLGPKNILHKIGNIFGYHDIDFNDYPKFSKRYLLQGENENHIRKVFNYDVIPWYESHSGVSTEGRGNSFIYYYATKKWAPERWRSLMTDALEAYHRLA